MRVSIAVADGLTDSGLAIALDTTAWWLARSFGRACPSVRLESTRALCADFPAVHHTAFTDEAGA